MINVEFAWLLIFVGIVMIVSAFVMFIQNVYYERKMKRLNEVLYLGKNYKCRD